MKVFRPDGGWVEELATGTGFPKVFYLNYHLYRDYFPILALAAFAHARTALARKSPATTGVRRWGTASYK